MGQRNSTLLAPFMYVRCLRIPADGSQPQVVTLPTTDNCDGNHDSYLLHLPNFRFYWVSEERWKFRTFGTLVVENHPQNPLNGLYYVYKSFALDDDVPANLHLKYLAKGDAFIVKMRPEELDENSWAAYVDVPEEIVHSSLLREMLDLMVSPGIQFWTLNYDEDRSYEQWPSEKKRASLHGQEKELLWWRIGYKEDSRNSFGCKYKVNPNCCIPMLK